MIWEWNGERVFINYMIMVDRNWSWKHWKQDSAVRRAWIVPDWNVKLKGSRWKPCDKFAWIVPDWNVKLWQHTPLPLRRAWIVPDWNVKSSEISDPSLPGIAWIVPDWNVKVPLCIIHAIDPNGLNCTRLECKVIAKKVAEWTGTELELYQIGM